MLALTKKIGELNSKVRRSYFLKPTSGILGIVLQCLITWLKVTIQRAFDSCHLDMHINWLLKNPLLLRSHQLQARREIIWVNVSFYRLCPEMASTFLQEQSPISTGIYKACNGAWVENWIECQCRCQLNFKKRLAVPGEPRRFNSQNRTWSWGFFVDLSGVCRISQELMVWFLSLFLSR